MCKIPCIPSPDEAIKLIELGFGDRMMLNSYVHPRKGRNIYFLCPAKKGLERKTNGNLRGRVRCTFQKEGLCQLHNICKPIEGRLAICKGPEPNDLRLKIVQLWDNSLAEDLVKSWIKKFQNIKDNNHPNPTH